MHWGEMIELNAYNRKIISSLSKHPPQETRGKHNKSKLKKEYTEGQKICEIWDSKVTSKNRYKVLVL